MARHVIPVEMDFFNAPTIIWDDEAGTVEAGTAEGGTAEGGSDYAASLAEQLAQGAPLDLSGDGHFLILQDPAHDPRDFWHLLPYKCQREPLRSRMPPILRDVEPTPRRAAAPPRITVDGVDVFPARAGMNQSSGMAAFFVICVPRASGDEPS